MIKPIMPLTRNSCSIFFASALVSCSATDREGPEAEPAEVALSHGDRHVVSQIELSELKAAADSGDGNAAFKVYLHLEFAPESADGSSQLWLDRAAELGSPQAHQFRLSRILHTISSVSCEEALAYVARYSLSGLVDRGEIPLVSRDITACRELVLSE